jgi:hypothetical protein
MDHIFQKLQIRDARHIATAKEAEQIGEVCCLKHSAVAVGGSGAAASAEIPVENAAVDSRNIDPAAGNFSDDCSALPTSAVAVTLADSSGNKDVAHSNRDVGGLAAGKDYGMKSDEKSHFLDAILPVSELWPESTCRFGTRIDWILLPSIRSVEKVRERKVSRHKSRYVNRDMPPLVISSVSCSGYKVLDCSELTDHNLVIASIDVVTQLG